MTKLIASVICRDVYTAVYRRIRKAEIASNMQEANRNTAVVSALNGIVIPTTSSRRARFKIPTTHSHADNAQPLTAEARAKLFGLRVTSHSDSQTNQNNEDQATGDVASEDQDYDVFGHGGGFD